MPAKTTVLRALSVLVLLSAVCLAPFPAGAQVQTLITDHFRIHYLPGTEGTARRVAETAEEVFAPLAAAYDYFDDFQTIHVLVLDSSDLLGNGAADYYGNTLYIWATNLDIELRGNHDWIRNVLTHELTHIITLNKARKKWPFAFALIQVSRYDANPDISFSMPLYHLNAPRGWSEGIAQYGAHKFGFDTWDSHRDMLLRMAVLEDDLLTWEELGNIEDRAGKYYGEMVYNQGYSLMLYIQEQYGAENVDELTHHVGLMSFDPAIRQVLGISADQLYENWQGFLRERYEHQVAELRRQGLVEGEPLTELNEGIIEYHPAWSPDGSRLAYLTSEDRDFAIPHLRIHDFGTGKDKTLDGYVDSRVAWSPDGGQVLFVRNKEGFNDLFLYDIEQDRERRISARLRAKDPQFSPNGERIAFVHNEDGTNNLGLINRDGTGLVWLTNNNDATQYWSPRWSPDGRWLLFSVFRGEDRDIALIRADSPPRPKSYGFRDRTPAADSLQVFPDTVAFPAADTSGFRALLATRADERDPCWLPDGSGFVFASDQSGIFNLYEYRMETGEVRQLTNVVGGAFTPTVSPDGKTLVYSGYRANDYSLYRLPLDAGRLADAGPTLSRDYRSIFLGPKLADEYPTTPYGGRQVFSYLPILQFGPTYVGNTFGLNQISGGVQLSSAEMLGGEELTAWGILGKNLKDDTDPNTDVGVYYQRSMLPRVGNNRTFNPTFYAAARRREIDNLVKPEPTILPPDTLASGTLYPVETDTADLLIPDVQQILYQAYERRDLFKTTMGLLALGIEIPLTRRQTLSLQYEWNDYNENWSLQRFRQQSRIYLVQDGVDISGSLPEEIQSQLLQDSVMVTPGEGRSYYRNLDFYTAHEVGAAWSYLRFKPTANQLADPQGRALSLAYRYQSPTVVDYLVDLGVDDEGAVRNDQVDDFGFPHDEFGVIQDRFTPVRTRLRVSEYIASYVERLGLPHDNTISLQLLGAYRDLRLKDPESEDTRVLEGRFHWPLRYYLGGMNLLSGYPYFSTWGSKLFYGRVGYSFPVLPRISRRFLNFTASKLYAELFAEAGAVGNFGSVGWGDLKPQRLENHFLTDAGAELRLQLFSFYRVPMTAFFQVARPFNRDRLPLAPDEPRPDRWRYYFGFGL